MVAAARDHRGPVGEQRHIALLVLATILTWNDPPAAAGVTVYHGSVDLATGLPMPDQAEQPGDDQVSLWQQVSRPSRVTAHHVVQSFAH